MGLQSVEQALERMVESVFSRSSRTTLRPVELGRRLLRDIDDHRTVDVNGRRIVPNVFTFYLSPADHAGFTDIDTALRHELAEAAREYARDEGYAFVGPVSIAFEVDNNLKPGRFGIFSHMRELKHAATPSSLVVAPAAASAAAAVAAPSPFAPQPAQPEPAAAVAAPAPLVQPAEVPLPGFTIAPAAGEPIAGLAAAQVGAAPLEPPVPSVAFVPVPPLDLHPVADPTPAAPPAPVARPAPATLVLPSGQRLAVTAQAVTIGRMPDCTIVINDPNVSRRHAEVRRGLHGTTVVDLGSTNGTKVNGQRVGAEHTLAAGDVITVGNTHLRFEAS
jgi:hypothetical protein